MKKGVGILFSCLLFFFLNLVFADVEKSFDTFSTFMSTQSQVGEPIKALLANPRFKRKILKSKTFIQFVTDMQKRNVVFENSDYKIETPLWSQHTQSVFTTDLYFVFYSDRIDLVMNNAALVNSCGKPLAFGKHPEIASTVSRDFLFALLFIAWQEASSKKIAVRIEGKKMNTNILLNQAFIRAGFKPVFPDAIYFIHDAEGTIDWKQSFEKINAASHSINLRFELF